MADAGKSNKPNYRVPALEKGFDILEALARSAAPMTLTQLANQLGRNTSEIYRVLTSLEQRGYIRREDHTGTYRLSLKLYELAHQHPPVQSLLHAALRPMEALADQLGESCHLSLLRRGNLVVLQQALSPTPVRLSIDVGGRFSPVKTVSGRLLLAYMPPADRDAFLRDNPDYVGMTDATRTAFVEKLARIREQGYSMAEHETHIGVRDYAVLVGHPNAGLTGALTVAALTSIKTPTDGATILKALHRCAKEITEELGFHDESPARLL